MRTRKHPRLAQTAFPGSASLRAFESAGRLGSFKRAGLELSVTESAISHQIRRLEGDLGTELFQRGHRQVKLTPAGRAYLEIVQQAHRDLAAATLSLEGSAAAQIRLSVLPAMAQYWLVPRLAALKKRLPEVSFSVMVSSDLADLDRDEIDIAIRYGSGIWPRCRIQHLMDEWVFPVAAPALARKIGARRQGEVARLQNLQHPEEWLPYEERFGGGEIIRLESSPLVLEAAKLGLGIAIGRRPFVEPYLKARTLMKLPGREIASGKGYFILSPAGKNGDRPEIRAAVAALLALAES